MEIVYLLFPNSSILAETIVHTIYTRLFYSTLLLLYFPVLKLFLTKNTNRCLQTELRPGGARDEQREQRFLRRGPAQR